MRGSGSLDSSSSWSGVLGVIDGTCGRVAAGDASMWGHHVSLSQVDIIIIVAHLNLHPERRKSRRSGPGFEPRRARI